jgi:hypothetical protein
LAFVVKRSDIPEYTAVTVFRVNGAVTVKKRNIDV